jgi:transcriptional regulator with XRE-family HTH domain
VNGIELKRRREEANLSQAELGAAIGLGHSIISRWELGQSRIPHRWLVKIKEILPNQPSTEEWDSTGVLVLSWH